jgi:hypothetical protein
MASALESGMENGMSGDEKKTMDRGEKHEYSLDTPPAADADILADPDAGLSEEERAVHVHTPLSYRT